MTVMAVSINEICESTKLAREMAVMGNYESSSVYYQGVIQQIHKLLMTILDESRRSKWQVVSKRSYQVICYSKQEYCIYHSYFSSHLIVSVPLYSRIRISCSISITYKQYIYEY